MRLRNVLPVLPALLVLALACAAGPVRAADPAWRIEVMPAVAVQADAVRLADVARPVGQPDAEAWESLAGIDLFTVPPEPGKRYTVSRDNLAQLLGRLLGPRAELCLLPGQLVVQRGGGVVLEEDLARLAVEFLTPRLRQLPGETSLRDWRLPAYVFLEEAGGAVDFELGSDLGPGRLTLRILERAPGGQNWRRFNATVFVDQWVTAPAAAVPLNRGDVLAPDKINFARVNLAYLKGQPWDGRTFGLRLVRAVGQDQTLLIQDLEEAPAVAKGDRLELVYQGRSVRLSTPVVALADGKLGQSIPVQNVQSGRQVLAVVRDAQTVVVQ
ncbi:MAG: flagellar basal body P-ring formation chaperone FlgA [Thermodesulfobacteriota bacterium]